MATLQDVTIPNYGDADRVTVAEVLVRPGDRVARDAPVLVLESDKASMDVPSTAEGTVAEVLVKVGDEVRVGTRILTVRVEEGRPAGAATAPVAAPVTTSSAAASPPAVPAELAEEEPAPGARTTPVPAALAAEDATTEPLPAPPAGRSAGVSVPPPAAGAEAAAAPLPHASPAVRRFARELGVDLASVAGTGAHGRVTREDVQAHVGRVLAAPPPFAAPGAPAGSAVAGAAAAPPAEVDHARFGPVEVVPLGRVRRLSAAHVQRAWTTIPHVTQHDEADVTDLEAFRAAHAAEAAAGGFKLTPLAFVLRAVARTLLDFPEMNSSLDARGEALVLKRYVHLGVAVDTPAGLVVPVLRDVDRKGILELARELALTSERARAGKLLPADFQGGSFSVSSLGGIGGTAFTPIINAPQVGILGVSRAALRPVWNGEAFVPRTMLPLALSYDHRVIDGAAAVRFTTRLRGYLGDIRTLLL